MTFDEWWESAKPASAVMDSAWEWEFRKYIAKAAWEAAQPQWRPMETAPKDGTELLLCSRKGRIASGCWSRADHKNKTGFWAWPYIDQEPTHWMPTPPAGAAQ